MAEPDASLYAVLVIAVVAVIGLSLSVASFATDQSMGRMMNGGSGMMNGTGGGTSSASAPGAFEWAILILSVALIAVAVAVFVWGRGRRTPAPMASPSASTIPAASSVVAPPAPSSSNAAAPAAPPAAPVPEPALMKLLDEDERRMYLEIRDHGGEMLQRDLVALGIFSKAKVTRVLDKLETKGIVVREAHGMTNRVRLVSGGVR